MDANTFKSLAVSLKGVTEPSTRCIVTLYEGRWYDTERFTDYEATISPIGNNQFIAILPSKRYGKKTYRFFGSGMRYGGRGCVTFLHPAPPKPTVLEQFVEIINGYAGCENWYVVMLPDGSGHVRDEHTDKFICNLPEGLTGERPPNGSRGFWFTELINKEGAGL